MVADDPCIGPPDGPVLPPSGEPPPPHLMGDLNSQQENAAVSAISMLPPSEEIVNTLSTMAAEYERLLGWLGDPTSRLALDAERRAILLGALASTLPDLLRDRDRLDWIEAEQAGLEYCDTGCYVIDASGAPVLRDGDFDYPTVRDAIDAARTPSPVPTEGEPNE